MLVADCSGEGEPVFQAVCRIELFRDHEVEEEDDDEEANPENNT